MAWYRTGAVSLTTGSNVVTGTGTDWKKNINGIGQGQALVANKTRVEIMYVDSDTQIRLAEPWSEPAYSGTYHIETAFAGTTGDSARQVMAALFLWKQMGVDWDEWLTSEAATVEVTNVFGEKVTIPTWKALAGASSLMAAVESITESLVTWKGSYSHKFKGGLSVGSSEYSGIELVQHTGRYTRIENTPHGAANFLTIVKRNADGSTISSYSIPSGTGTAATQQWVNQYVGATIGGGSQLQTSGATTSVAVNPNSNAGVWDSSTNRWLLRANPAVGSMDITKNIYLIDQDSGSTSSKIEITSPDGNTKAGLWVYNDKRTLLSGYKGGSWTNIEVSDIATKSGTGWGTGLNELCRDMTNFRDKSIKSGVYRYVQGYVSNIPSGVATYGTVIVARYDGDTIQQQMVLSNYGTNYLTINRHNGTSWEQVSVLTSNQYTVDGNGFYKRASPIVTINNKGYTTNRESRGAKVARLGTGEYEIRNVLGYNSDGAWGVNGGISVPKDNNGLELVYVKDEIRPDGSIIIRTFHRQHSHLPEMFQNTRKKPDGSVYADGEPCELPEYTRLDVRVEMPKDSLYNVSQAANMRYLTLSDVLRAIRKVLSNDTLCLPAPAGI